ncbi:TonB-dependent siderophore receptor [Phenylobacterium sp.]|uniref:TonB-dependent receptor plug domain-containing protein n=1 Tax=Phenylobacterium sp. TaxID=1871053 RepID=UPI0027326187|nr:TonB-dependent receptor [Phenylobacterium sp.]MDP3854244.1 TonB-dependent receptor [Phenylobacterium sp.]
MKSIFAGVSALALACGMAGAAVAQTTDEAAAELDVLIVTGTRMTGLRAVDSPAPIQVLDETALARVAQTDLIQAIAQNVPSFNAQAFGGDTANLTLSAKLRGLSPNHALVLINGKRRHGTSNLAVLGGPFQGGATADLNFIPLGSVSHIEVLQDGAAAQYGTDAIAGVINIILKKNTEGGSIVLSGGEFMDGGGLTGDLTANLGLAPIDGAYLNLTLESRWHDHTFRGDVDPRTIDTAFNTASSSRLSRYPLLAGAADYPYMNRIPGDAEYRLNIFSFNAGYEISDSLELYSFGTFGMKYGAAYENYRVPNLVVGKDGTLPRPLGFSPKEALDETDYAVSFGIKGQISDTWNWDLSTTYGRDEVAINVLDSVNRSLYIDTSTLTTKGFSPTDFHAGDFMASQWTTTLDVAREYDVGLATPLNLALGAEYRKEEYEIKPGDEASRYKEGSQSYPGFALTDAGAYDRTNWAIYANVAVSPIEALQLDAAIRYEHFSDFGDTTVVKGTGRYDFNEAFAIRGTASTGFRAPTLAESFYSATNVSPTAAFVQLPPNSPAARLVGIDGLKPEKSTNFSIGFVAHPGAGFTVTFDAYEITVEDRIVGSGALFGSGGAFNIAAVRAAILANGNVLDPTVTQTGITIFTNGLETRTRGAELVLTTSSDFGDYGGVQWSLTANFNETEVTKISAPPAQLAGASLFNLTAISNLEDTSPKYRFVGGALWTWDKLTVNLREALYGPSSNLNSRTGAVYYKTEIEATLITDLEVSYKFTDSVKLAVGANNLFNTYPDKVNAQLRDEYFRNNSNAYVTQYPTFSPFGINGGYYYSKLSFTF